MKPFSVTGDQNISFQENNTFISLSSQPAHSRMVEVSQVGA
jgi:hypothetical protein